LSLDEVQGALVRGLEHQAPEGVQSFIESLLEHVRRQSIRDMAQFSALAVNHVSFSENALFALTLALAASGLREIARRRA
jgi:hypothetical protein